MTNDDKDLKLKECPFCSGLVKSHIVPTGKLIFICLICEVQWTKCGDISTFNALNARPTPQQPSEPLKELDRIELTTMALGYFGKIHPDQVNDTFLVQKFIDDVCSKFGQPSEKKALSVEDIELRMAQVMQDMLTCCENCSQEYSFMEVARHITKEINLHSAMPAQREVRYPEKSEHSQQCLYVIEPRYFGKPNKEKFCDCGAFERNLTIDEFKKLNGG